MQPLRSKTAAIESAAPDNNPKDKKVQDRSQAGIEVTVKDLRDGKKIWGHHKERCLTPDKLTFKEDILEGQIGLNLTANEEVFRQRIDGFEAISQLEEKDVNHLVSSMKKNESPFCFKEDKFILHTLFQKQIGLIGNWIEHQKTTGGDPTES